MQFRAQAWHVLGKSEKRMDPRPAVNPLTLKKSDVKVGALFPHKTPCFSLVPVLGQSSSPALVSTSRSPCGEGASKKEAGRGCSTSEAPSSFWTLSHKQQVTRRAPPAPSSSAKPLIRTGQQEVSEGPWEASHTRSLWLLQVVLVCFFFKRKEAELF